MREHGDFGIFGQYREPWFTRTILAKYSEIAVLLFVELCGSSFSSYLDFSRVQNLQQVKDQKSVMNDKMREVDAFLSAYYIKDNQFTLAEAHIAPFVQRSCGILPHPYDPLSIADQLCLEYLKPWIQLILERESVQKTAPIEEMEDKGIKLSKRLKRIQDKGI